MSKPVATATITITLSPTEQKEIFLRAMRNVLMQLLRDNDHCLSCSKGLFDDIEKVIDEAIETDSVDDAITTAWQQMDSDAKGGN